MNVRHHYQYSNMITAMVLSGREQTFMPCFSRKMWREWRDTRQSSLLVCKAVPFQKGTQGSPPRAFGGKSEIDCWICWPLMVLCYKDVVALCCKYFILFTATTLRMTTVEMKWSISLRVQTLLQRQVTILFEYQGLYWVVHFSWLV
jgi:hypothetical protein